MRNPTNVASVFQSFKLSVRIPLLSKQDISRRNLEIGFFSRVGNLDAARQLFDGMSKRDVVSWNAIITSHWQNNDFLESKKLFECMPKRNNISWNTMIAGCLSNGLVDEAFRYFIKMPDRNVASWNVMISGFVRFDRMDEAEKLYEEMHNRNVISYTVMVDGFARNGKMNRARKLFDMMPERNAVSWAAMISEYVENGSFEEAKFLFDQMPEKNVVAITAMITGYCREGKVETVRKLFEGICHKDIVSWNTMISGYSHNSFDEDVLKLEIRMMEEAFAQHGLYQKVLSFFRDMDATEFIPNGITFLGLLSACGHAGKVDESLTWFRLMVSTYGITRRPEHYACIIDILSRAGMLEKACEQIKDMPFGAEGTVWGALLGTCQMYRNLSLGELAAERLLQLDPTCSGAYVMLSNIYAAVGMWEGVTNVREVMKRYGVKKQPAYSWTEISDKVHLFLGWRFFAPRNWQDCIST
ncbi:hypothetical protein HPP92_016193 [Vanilla planifolia]|uniref:Pentatricopeptide repeat-containing protein n=1 Tax=Vanilla planifolia TaxID=51239 RepID=A0A835QMM8_VANPL|nr:hypothetical protein HPP92_016193 [Vanilla planifolia]